MNALELKTYPDLSLRVKTTPVNEFSNNLRNAVRTMADIMYIDQGIGLASPQVGLDLDLLVIDIGNGLITFANAVIVEQSKEKTIMEEGCLSCPAITVKVKRPSSITVRAQDINGKVFIDKYTGLAAKVIQHEMDHLKGQLIIDYLNPVSKWLAIRKLKKFKNPNLHMG